MAKPRFDRKAILEKIRKDRAFQGNGVQRKGLFLDQAKVTWPLKCWILPELKPRGTDGDMLPALRLATHWVTVEREDGSEGRRGLTCVEDLSTQEPFVWKRLLEKGLATEPARCPHCRVYAQSGDDFIVRDTTDTKKIGLKFPLDKFKHSILVPGVKYHFLVLPEREAVEADDDQPVKIFSVPVTGFRSAILSVYDEDNLAENLFEAQGAYVKWEKEAKRWVCSVLANQKKPWLAEWETRMLDLEIVTPTFFPESEQWQILLQNYPHREKEIREAQESATAPRVKAAVAKAPAEKPKTRKQVLKARVSKAG